MKNFDLEAAKRGAAVCTRREQDVRIVCFDRLDSVYPIVGLCRNNNGSEFIEIYTSAGSKFCISEDGSDLMMCDDDYLEKLERGEYQSGQIRPLYENPSNSMPLNLTKREWFAGMAMAGEISGCLAAGNGFDGDKSIPGIIAKSSVMIADAMIEELEKTDK